MFSARRSIVRKLALSGLAVGLSLALVACGGDGSSDRTNRASKGSGPSTSVNPAVSANAAPESIEAATRQLFGGQVPSQVRESPITGLMEVFVADNVYYASPDGKFFMQGDMIEVATRQSKTEEARKVVRVEVIKDIDVKDSITFKAQGEEKYEIFVFTDTDCGYCRKFHEEIDQYTSRGITVHYLPWPRSGSQGPTFDTMVSVWCARDKQKAITDAKMQRPVKPATCDNPVQKYLDIGRRMLVTGTPAVFIEDGSQLGGYLPAEPMLQQLQQLHGEVPAAVSSMP